MTPIYLDHAATTPVEPRVAAAMAECLTVGGAFGNPASAEHAYGREAAGLIETARAQVGALVGAPAGWVVFTSGATEANNLAVFGVAQACADRGRHLVASAIEHRAVVDPLRRLAQQGFAVSWVAPDASGRVSAAALQAAVREDTVLVSIMHANNEVGVVQDLASLARVAHGVGALLHTDAAQSAGKLPFDVRLLKVDLAAFTAHKIYGPKGIGALVVTPDARPWLQPQMLGGGHEGGLRSGTPATHQIVGFGVAAAIAAEQREAEAGRITALREQLWQRLVAALGGVQRNGHAEHCVPGILSVSFDGVHGESLVAGLEELALSTGSACSSATAEPSAVLRALGVPERLAESTLRLSLGRGTGADDAERAAAAIIREVRRLRAAAP